MIRTPTSLENATAVVTGASSGIGRAIAIALAESGASLFLVGRNAERLRVVEEVFRQGRVRVTPILTDLADPRSVDEAVDRICRTTDGVEVLVHSAGVIQTGSVAELQQEVVDRGWQVNFRAPYQLTRGLLSRIAKAEGQIVFVNSSVVTQSGKTGLGAYSATKHALKALADSLRAEVNPLGIRVLSIYPGQTASPMQQTLYQAAGQVYRPENLLQPEDIAETVIHALTMPRTAEITDVMIRPMQKS